MTRTRYGVSPWLDEFPKRRRPDFPRLREPATFPVVIIGVLGSDFTPDDVRFAMLICGAWTVMFTVPIDWSSVAIADEKRAEEAER